KQANLGFLPHVDSDGVRMSIPPMDEARRKEHVKDLHKKGEECKVRIRKCRQEANDQLRKMKASGEIAEDSLKRQEKEVQELTDSFCKKVDQLSNEKEKEIMTV